MTFPSLDLLQAEIAALRSERPFGQITRARSAALEVSGLSRKARLGDGIRLWPTGGAALRGEVIGIAGPFVTVLPEGSAEGLALGDRAELIGPAAIHPHDSWVGRIVDPLGRPLDGRPLARGPMRALRSLPPPAAERARLGARLDTGMAVFDTFLPLVAGQRIGLFAGSGVGKSSLLGRFARGVTADLAVIALIGERGRELRDFAERVLGAEGMARSIIVTATSDQPALMRRRCAWAAMAVAEHFRDQGLHVLFLADSVTRFAEAHREVALAAGEPATLRGFPPSTAHLIMGLAERAGPGAEGTGAEGVGAERAGQITGVFSVLVAGSDMEEPVADILRGTLDGHVILDRAIAERGRFPAIDLLRSVSRALPEAASMAENALIARARRLLGAHAQAELMIRAGLYAPGSDLLVDEAIRVWPGLDAFIAEDAPGGVAESFDRLAAYLKAADGPGPVVPDAPAGATPAR